MTSSPEGLAALKIDRVRKSRPRAWKRWLIIPVVIALLVVAAKPLSEAMLGVEVEVAAVTKKSGTAVKGKAELSAAGYVVADRQSVLAFKGTGRLKDLRVWEAKPVKKDEKIAEIDHSELDALIAQTRAELDEAKAEHLRQQREEVEVERLREVFKQIESEAKAAKTPLETIEAEINEIHISLADIRRKQARDKVLVAKDAMAAMLVEDREVEINMALAKVATAEKRKLETLARINVTDAQVGVARATVVVAESRWKSAVNVAAARVASSESRVKVLEAQLAEASIYAPFDGVVTEKAAEVGEIVAPISIGGSMARGSIVTIAEWASLQAEVDVAETYIGQVAAEQRAAITVDAFPKKTFPGKVRRILPRANRSKATVQVRVDFIRPEGTSALSEAILPEMGVRVKFLPNDAPEGAETGAIKDKILIPQAAAQNVSGKSFVWVVADGKAEKVEVTLGAADGESIEVTEGLDVGQKVVVKGVEALREDKQKVRLAEK